MPPRSGAVPLSDLPADQRETIAPHLESCPVRIGGLARDLGLAVRLSRMTASGRISRDRCGRHVIWVNRREARPRQRFSVARGLAHFLLHRTIVDRLPEGISWNVLWRSGVSGTVDRAADRLAGELIMPETLLGRRIGRFGGAPGDLAECLAGEFAVTVPVMKARLREIG